MNIRNLFDSVYVQDALDNSRYNAIPFRVNDHSANAAEVFLGMPTSYNLGFKFNFLVLSNKHTKHPEKALTCSFNGKRFFF